MNWLVKLLRLCAVIPSLKSTIKDRVGLLVWTCFALGPVIAVIIEQEFHLRKLLHELNIFSFFTFLSLYGNAVIRASLTIPAIHFHVKKNPSLFTVIVKLPEKMFIFCLDVVLACLSFIAIAYFTTATSHSNYGQVIFVIMNMTSYLLMILSTFIIGLSMAQLKNDQMKTTELFALDASASLDKFINLKAGISPLLFLVYTVKVLTLIVLPVCIFTGLGQDTTPIWVNSLSVAYISVDIFYINTVATNAYEYVQSIILQLRSVVKPVKYLRCF